MIFDLDPAIFHFWIFEVRYYGVLFGSAFIIGYFIIFWMWRLEGRPLEEVDILILYMALGVILGARLGHVLFYQPGFYFSHPLEILKVWRGGLASHGAAIGSIIAAFAFARKYRYSFLWLTDRLVVPIALGSSFVRIGNFTNSEIVGRTTDLPWAVTFLRYDNLPRHPSQLYEAAIGIAIFILLLVMYRKLRGRLKDGVLLACFTVAYFSLRFLVEFVKEYQALPSTIPLTMGQFLSLPFVLLGLVILYWLRPLLVAEPVVPKNEPPRPPAKKKKKRKK